MLLKDQLMIIAHRLSHESVNLLIPNSFNQTVLQLPAQKMYVWCMKSLSTVPFKNLRRVLEINVKKDSTYFFDYAVSICNTLS